MTVVYQNTVINYDINYLQVSLVIQYQLHFQFLPFDEKCLESDDGVYVWIICIL